MWEGVSQIVANSAVLTAIVAVLLWVFSRLAEIIGAARRRFSVRESLIRSLYAEVDFNTRDLEFFGANSATMEAISTRLRQSDSYLPHITDAHHTIIYTSRISDLHYLDDGLTARLVLFYGLLDKIKAQIDGINQPSYARVSAEGKIAVIARILANVRECEKEGAIILRIFSERYGKYKLLRHARSFTDTQQR